MNASTVTVSGRRYSVEFNADGFAAAVYGELDSGAWRRLWPAHRQRQAPLQLHRAPCCLGRARGGSIMMLNGDTVDRLAVLLVIGFAIIGGHVLAGSARHGAAVRGR
jgi:hypothetical protein